MAAHRMFKGIAEKISGEPECVESRILTATTVYLSTYPDAERRGEIILLS